ncbi:MAG: hypothetical protein ACOVOV_15105, partial [Dolichospermum sp.]
TATTDTVIQVLQLCGYEPIISEALQGNLVLMVSALENTSLTASNLVFNQVPGAERYEIWRYVASANPNTAVKLLDFLDGSEPGTITLNGTETYGYADTTAVINVEYAYYYKAFNDTLDLSATSNEIKEMMKEVDTALVGGFYAGIGKWRGGAKAPNGKYYYAPHMANQILEYNPVTKTTALVGSVYTGNAKWIGGILAEDGNIYFAPCNATQILKLDLATMTTSLVGSVYGTGGNKWHSGVLASNGHLYFAPHNENQILKYNVATGVSSLVGTSYSALAKWSGFVSNTAGTVLYASPNTSNQILKFDVATETTSLVGTSYTGSSKWQTGTLHPNGKIYFCPVNQTKILEFDPATNTTTLVGGTATGYLGIFTAMNGKIYLIPILNNNRVLEFNPTTGASRLVGQTYTGVEKWLGTGVIADNGRYYVAPYSGTQILEIYNTDEPIVLNATTIPADLTQLSESNYNKYYNKY